MSEAPTLEEQRLYQIIGRKESRINNLESENETLRDQLKDALAHHHNPEPRSPIINADHATLEADLVAVKRDHDDLQKRYDDLLAKQDKLDERARKADQKYEAAKNSAKQWKAYIDKQRQRQHANSRSDGAAINPTTPEIQPDLLPTSDRGGTPRTAVRRQDSGEAEDDAVLPTAPNDSSSAVHSGSTSRIPSHTSGAAPRSSPPTSTENARRITSSQTTEADETAPEARAKNDQPLSSDGEIEIVSERILKRKRSDSRSAMPPPTRIKQEQKSPDRPGSADRPLEIKSEGLSSPIAQRNPVMRVETSDLDAMTGALRTPRRRRLAEAANTRAMSEEATRPTFRPPRMVARNSSSLSDGDVADMDDRIRVLREDANPVARGQQETQTEVLSINGRSIQRQKPQPRGRGALRHLSPNVPTPSRASKVRSDRTERAKKAAIVAEDGDEDESQVTPKQKAPESARAKAPTSARLEAMLDSPTQIDVRKSPPKRKTPDLRRRIRQSPIDNSSNSTPKLAPSNPPLKPAQSTPRPPPRRQNLDKSPPPIRPEEEPLRLKPPTALRPSDFRINPSYTSVPYAHATSIRDKKTKACLPSCTRPECCGAFLTAARLGTLPRLSKTREEILAAYLGADHRELMRSFGEAKRQETWIQAQAQAAAGEFGKHRVVFERRRSPPGFWRTGMPSTQEAREDRRVADERERERVEEMWREALRGGGRWVFRDEVAGGGRGRA